VRSKSEEGWVMRFRVQGSEFRVQGSGFRVLRELRKSFVALTPNLSRNSEL
jgi:hypothetical protein